MRADKILLLEDQLSTAERFRRIAQSVFPNALITHAASIAQARNLLSGELHDCSVAILDIGLPDGNGVELARELKRQLQDCKIIMSTVFDDDHHLFAALHAGACGYLLKELTDEEIIDKLKRMVHLQEPPLSPGVARRLLAHFHPATDSAATSLTPRETETLTLLAKGYSVKELARLLNISHHTAAGYVKTIYQKLQISSRAEATSEACRLNLIAH